MKYRAEIDGLRALAVIPVIFFHAGFELFNGGFIGVDVFFVISGYLITTVLIEDIENKRFSILNFYERRARRILPALFFIMITCIPFAWMWMLPSQMKDFSQSLVAVSLFLSNVLFWLESDYFAAASEEKPLLHTWSLAVEEQYYLLFPIFLILFWRFGKNKVFWTIFIIALISLLLSELGWRKEPSANFYLSFTRVWELFAGSLVAFIVKKNGVQKNNFLAIIGLTAIIFSIFFYDETTPFPSLYALVPVLGVVLFVLYAEKETLAAKFLSRKLFVGIGLISYSAYLWHQPLFAFARVRLSEYPSSLLMAMLSSTSIVLAYFSWRYVEKPFRESSNLGQKLIFLFSLIGLVSFLVIGFIGYKTNGFVNFITTAEQREILSTAAHSPKRIECHSGDNDHLTYKDSCEYFSKNISVAVLGDSHTVELSYALAEELQKKDIGIKHLSKSGCVPLFRIYRSKNDFSEIPSFESCKLWTSQVIQGIITDERIETVVISYRIAYALYGHHHKYYPQIIDERGEIDRQKLWNSLLNIIETLENTGKKTIIVLQAPELPKRIGYLIPSDNLSSANGVPLNWWNSRMEFVYKNIDDLLELSEVIDPRELFCNDKNCLSVKDGKALYFDNHHLSVEGARYIANAIISELF